MATPQVMSRYLDFRLLRDSGKTSVYGIYSKSQGDRLATVKWYGAWRQYTFWPETETVWNKGCLEDVNVFIGRLMRDRLAPADPDGQAGEAKSASGEARA